MKAKDLKNSILQLAVQGKLVEQDSNDEPASVLIERIREARAKLIKEKKIKAPKGGESVIWRASDGSYYEKRVGAKGRESEPVCIDDEIPFEIPDSWEWCRLESVLSLKSGLGYKKDILAIEEERMVRVLRGSNISKSNRIMLADNDIMIARSLVDDSLMLKRGQIITPAVTSLENVGKAALVENDLADTVCGVFVFFLTPTCNDLLNSSYLWVYLTSPNHVTFCKEHVKKSGQAFYNLSKASLNSALIAVPPSSEQERIVERVEMLMLLVEEYGRLEDEREELDASLTNRLRKSVLQMAVQGKLVAQDPLDEPASKLLKRIREERHQLITEKKLKVPKGGESIIYRASDGGYYEKRVGAKGRESEPVCIDDEIPFEIPDSWEWCRLGSLCNYGQCTNAEYSGIDDGTWVLELEDIEKDTGRYIKKSRKNGGIGSIKHTFVAGNILYSKLRPYLNKVVIADEDGAATSEILPLDFLGLVDLEYAQLTLMTPMFLDYADKCSYGVKMPRLGTADGCNALIPVPPLNEQQHIVQKSRKFIEQITR